MWKSATNMQKYTNKYGDAIRTQCTGGCYENKRAGRKLRQARHLADASALNTKSHQHPLCNWSKHSEIWWISKIKKTHLQEYVMTLLYLNMHESGGSRNIPTAAALLVTLQRRNIQALSRLLEADVIPPPLQRQLESSPSTQGTSVWYVFELTSNRGGSVVENKWAVTNIHREPSRGPDFCSSVSPSGLSEDLSGRHEAKMGRQGTGKCDRRPGGTVLSMYFMMISFLPSLGRCAGHTQLEVTEDDPGEAGSRLQSGAPRCSSYIYDTFSVWRTGSISSEGTLVTTWTLWIVFFYLDNPNKRHITLRMFM